MRHWPPALPAKAFIGCGAAPEASTLPRAAVTCFARATGELHSLSAVDVKVIALAYELERAAHGDARLRAGPAPPRPHARRSARGARLPGWGDTGGDWAQLDALADAEAAAAERSMQGARPLHDALADSLPLASLA